MSSAEENGSNVIVDKIAALVENNLNLEEIYETTSDLLMQFPHVDMVMVYMVDDALSEAVLESFRNVNKGYLKKASRIPHPMGITWKVIETNKALCLMDAQKDPNIGPAGKALGKHGVLGMPVTLSKAEKAQGVIWLWSDEKYEFTAEEIRLLSVVGNKIATAVAWAKLIKVRREKMEKTLKSLIDLVGFGEQDRSVLADNSSKIQAWADEIVGEAFDSLSGAEAVSGIFKEDEIKEMGQAVRVCLTNVLSGNIDEKFWQYEWSMGLEAVVKGVPVNFVPALVSRLQQRFLTKCTEEFDTETAVGVYNAFKRATDVVAGLITEGYLDAYTEGVGITSGMKKALIQRMAKLGAEEMSKRSS